MKGLIWYTLHPRFGDSHSPVQREFYMEEERKFFSPLCFVKVPFFCSFRKLLRAKTGTFLASHVRRGYRKVSKTCSKLHLSFMCQKNEALHNIQFCWFTSRKPKYCLLSPHLGFSELSCLPSLRGEPRER